MHTTAAQLTRALELVETKASAGAFGRVEELVGVIEHALESYLDSTLRHPHVLCEVSTELLWRQFARLTAAVRARDATRTCAAAADLRADLQLHHDAHQPQGRSAPA